MAHDETNATYDAQNRALPMPKPISSRVTIHDRAHALAIAKVAVPELLAGTEGTVEGFADWLFLNRRTFNGKAPERQVQRYLSWLRIRKGHGANLDEESRRAADQREEAAERGRTHTDEIRGVIQRWCVDSSIAAEVSLSIASLCLARGRSLPESMKYPTSDASHPCRVTAVLNVFDEMGALWARDYPTAGTWYPQSELDADLEQIARRLNGTLYEIVGRCSLGADLEDHMVSILKMSADALQRLDRVRTLLQAALRELQILRQIEKARTEVFAQPCRQRRSLL